MCLCLDDFREQLIEDSAFLKADWRLDTELVDKLILQLNRIYPQILTDKEATKFRNLDVPTSVRMGELLTHLQGKGEEACREFYRALHLHVEEVYYSLPTRLRLRDPLKYQQDCPQRHVLNDRGEKNLLECSITCLFGVQNINLTASVISSLPFKMILPLPRSCLLHELLQHCSGNGLTLLLQRGQVDRREPGTWNSCSWFEKKSRGGPHMVHRREPHEVKGNAFPSAA
uniref:Caspase recruitment domain-containing protein 19 n=1 Tax=Takifugu rubripes TaxID=31033 RepID=A0A674PIG5_TAKRU